MFHVDVLCYLNYQPEQNLYINIHNVYLDVYTQVIVMTHIYLKHINAKLCSILLWFRESTPATQMLRT
jgi:hypothetical protein